MESSSDNDSDFALNETSDSDNDYAEDDVFDNVNRIWMRVPDVNSHEYPHEIHEFDRQYGPVNPPHPDSHPLDYFRKLTIPNEGRSLVEILVEETNRYANQCMSNENYDPKPRSRTLEWYDTDETEMSAFLGIYLSMGILKKPTIESYWSQAENSWLYSSPGFPSIMKRDRYQLLMKFLHCNNNETHIVRGQDGHDPCHKFRPILDLVNTTFPLYYNAARDLTVDESMVGFKGRNNLIQYVPNKKTHRWGAKFFVLAESDTGYSISLHLYTGRQGNEHRSGNGVGYDICMKLMQPFLYRHHHVVLDNYFTSPDLCENLFDADTYMTGTVRGYRKGMPRSFRGLRLRKGETEVRQGGDMMALAYGDRKTVTFLSTMASPRIATTENARGCEINLPLVNDIYNRKMGGVDLADKAIHTYDPDIRNCKMWKRILINLLLRIMNNAYIIYRQNRGLRQKLSRLDFYMAVYQGLVGEYRQERRRSGRRSAASDLARLTERHFIDVIDGKKRKVCRVCDSRVRTWCSSCDAGLCMGNCFRQFHTLRNYSHPQEE